MPTEETLDWSQHYLLGWYGWDGRAYLSTWSGDLPIKHYVVLGCKASNMPLWNAPVPSGATLLPVPMGENPGEYAARLGGYHAIGWEVPVDRRVPA
jgi:hypothetical protein